MERETQEEADVTVKSTDPAAFRLATYLVIAARGLIEDPANYGPFRLIDAVDRYMVDVFDDDFLREIKPELERGFDMLMADPDSVTAWLDDLTTLFAKEAKRRNLSE